MDPDLFPEIPADFAELTDDELVSFIDGTEEAIRRVSADARAYVSEDRSGAQLLAELQASVAALEAARTVEAKRLEAAAADEDDDDKKKDDDEEPTEDELAAAVAKLAETVEPKEEPKEEKPEPVAVAVVPDAPDFAAMLETAVASAVEQAVAKIAAPEPEQEEPETVVASTAIATTPGRLPRPSKSRKPAESEQQIAMTAAAGGLGFDIGQAIPNEGALAEMMTRRRQEFGRIPDGTRGEKVTIARSDWRGAYPEERVLTKGQSDTALIAAATDMDLIKSEMKRRKRQDASMTASGGLCAPVTPYYQLQMISTAGRPVRAALPSFNADRGGINYARPAALSAVTTAVGIKTAEEDELGGTFATKTCQVVPCPPFQETDVAIIYHCLQFGNLGARTFPERVTQWNSLVLAAHARTAESALLTGIDTASTAVHAGSLGLGATADLFPQILAAANGMRNRHRMDPEAVLRLMMPDWAIDLLVSDVIRSQFERFDTDEQRVVALLRSFDIEPTFYIDGANGRSQVFGAQSAGNLLTFPPTVTWYLYPEGSFIYLDGGVLELGLVRDSVLNATNDFQIFGESFENVAFVGIESLAVESHVCDSGTVTAPRAVNCGYSYAGTT